MNTVTVDQFAIAVEALIYAGLVGAFIAGLFGAGIVSLVRDVAFSLWLERTSQQRKRNRRMFFRSRA